MTHHYSRISKVEQHVSFQPKIQATFSVHIHTDTPTCKQAASTLTHAILQTNKQTNRQTALR
jgi:hypothetical protein